MKKLLATLYCVSALLIIVFFTVVCTRIQLDSNSKLKMSRRNLANDSEKIPVLPKVLLKSKPPTEAKLCNPVHVAVFVQRTTDALVLLKSLLLYRQCPIHIHFVIDANHVSVTLSKLMYTWSLASVDFSLHNITQAAYQHVGIDVLTVNKQQMVSLVKLLLPLLMPKTVLEVIYFDLDYVFTSDITEMWSFCHNKKESFGVPYSISDAFCTNRPSTIYYNLKVLRKNHAWGQVKLDSSVGVDLKNKSLNSSDVVCLTFKELSFFRLPCYWNANLYQTSEFKNCYLPQSAKGFYWNKAIESSSLSYFKKINEFISNYDGSLLSFMPINCSKNTSKSLSTQNDASLLMDALGKGQEEKMCSLVKSQWKQVFRTLMYFIGKPYKPVSIYETTLVTQLSLDRLRTFGMLVRQWDGPICISMYGTDAEAVKFLDFVTTFSLLAKRTNVIVHVIFKQGDFYPVNYLRNLALNSVSTSYVFLNDGDFIPVKGLYRYLKVATKRLMTKENPKMALIVPAFETAKFTLKFPKTKQELLQQIRLKLVSQFCVTCAHKTHAPTDYRLWFKARNPYRIQWASHFEPYVIVRRDVARYDERFMGYGYNKVSQITELKAQGYEFVVLPDVFIIHTPHSPTIDKKIWEHQSFKGCINSIWEEFLNELQKKYGHNCLKEARRSSVLLKNVVIKV